MNEFKLDHYENAFGPLYMVGVDKTRSSGSIETKWKKN